MSLLTTESPQRAEVYGSKRDGHRFSYDREQKEAKLRRYRTEKYEGAKVETARIRCTGGLHRITIYPGGRVKFHDHSRSEISALKTLRALGDESCGCLGVVYKLGTEWFVPKFASAIRRAQAVRGLRGGRPIDLRISKDERFAVPSRENKDMLFDQMFDRARAVVARYVREVLAVDQFAFGFAEKASVRFDYQSRFDAPSRSWTRRPQAAVISMPMSHWRHLFGKLAVVSNNGERYLVLEVLSEEMTERGVVRKVRAARVCDRANGEIVERVLKTVAK